MSFIKSGDAQKIDAVFDDDKAIICDKCGKTITTIQITADQNEPICTCEDKDDE
jgi:hypothetical protein